MHTRICLTLSVLAAAIAAIAAPAARSSAAASNCGVVSGGGARWSVAAAHVSCRAAKQLVTTLAAKPHPTLATRLGTHLGLKCIEYARGRTREIACISSDGIRSVYGLTPPRT